MIGKLQRVPLRNVWKHEALDFTTWLEDNPDVLSDALGIDISNVERENDAGDFFVDLVAEDESGATVVIENQLEKSNHNHLGKLLTYLAAFEAKTAVWIVSDPRPEHVKAIAWLNDSSSADFYMLKIEAVQIEDSPPAPLLTRIVGPSEESKKIKAGKDELSERHLLNREFWTSLLDRARQKTALHSSCSPTTRSYFSTGAGSTGLSLEYNINNKDGQIFLYMNRGDDKENQAIFEHFHKHKEAIESDFGDALEWQAPSEGRRAYRIIYTIDKGGLHDKEKWPQMQEEMIDGMIKLEAALRPHIQNLRV